jgi:hypothetical protein
LARAEVIGYGAVSEPHEMENVRWNDLSPDEQDLIVFTLQAAAKLRLVRPDMLTREKLDDIPENARFAQRRK